MGIRNAKNCSRVKSAEALIIPIAKLNNHILTNPYLFQEAADRQHFYHAQSPAKYGTGNLIIPVF